jgi:hypothetical protein
LPVAVRRGRIRTQAPETDSSYPGPGFGLPPADTGNHLLNWISDTGLLLLAFERRFDPFFRPAFAGSFETGYPRCSRLSSTDSASATGSGSPKSGCSLTRKLN